MAIADDADKEVKLIMLTLKDPEECCGHETCMSDDDADQEAPLTMLPKTTQLIFHDNSADNAFDVETDTKAVI